MAYLNEKFIAKYTSSQRGYQTAGLGSRLHTWLAGRPSVAAEYATAPNAGSPWERITDYVAHAITESQCLDPLNANVITLPLEVSPGSPLAGHIFKLLHSQGKLMPPAIDGVCLFTDPESDAKHGGSIREIGLLALRGDEVVERAYFNDSLGSTVRRIVGGSELKSLEAVTAGIYAVTHEAYLENIDAYDGHFGLIEHTDEYWYS